MMSGTSYKRPVCFILLWLIIAGCDNPASPDPDSVENYVKAKIDLAGIPSGIWVGDTLLISITGILSDSSCFIMDHIEQVRHADTVDVIVWADRQEDVECEAFQVNFSIDKLAIEPPYFDSLTIQLFGPESLQIVKTVNIVSYNESARKVVFESDMDNINYSDLFLVDIDGSNLVNLTWTSGGGNEPHFLTDGSGIIYIKSGYLYKMDLQGNNVEKLSDIPEVDPSYLNLEGHNIAFTSKNAENPAPLHILNLENGMVQTYETIGEITGVHDLSPDGNTAVFRSYSWGERSVNLLDLSSGEVSTIFKSSRQTWWLKYSPDGSKIAFTHDQRYGIADLYIMASDGSDTLNLTHSDGQERYSEFTPDGSTLIYEAWDGRMETNAIYSVMLDGSAPIKLSTNQINAIGLNVSSDGSLIVHSYGSDDWTERGIAVMNLDGSEWRSIVRGGGMYPKIQPQ